MDIKRLSTAMLISALVMLAIMYFKPDLFGGKAPIPPLAQPQSVTNTATAPAATVAASNPAVTQEAAAAVAAPEIITLGSAAHGAHYKLELTINNAHARIDRAQLNIDQYAETVKKLFPLTLFKAAPELNAEPFATTGLVANNVQLSLMKNPDGSPLTWFVDHDKTNDTKATLYYTVYYLNKPWIRVEKIFQIDPNSYEATITYHVVNLLDLPTNVQIDQTGPINLWNKPPDDFRSDSRTYQAATYNLVSQEIFSDAKPIAQTTLASPPKSGTGIQDLGSFNGPDRVVWVSAGSRFFAVIARPLPRSNAPADPLRDGRTIGQIDFLERAWAEPLYYATIPPETIADSLTGIRFQGKAVTVSPNNSVDMALSVYMGPKKESILEGTAGAPAAGLPFTARLPYLYNLYQYLGAMQVNRGGCYSFMTFPKLAFATLWVLDLLHRITRNWGVAIIILVIVIRLCLHPLTRYSQVTMAKMQQKMAAIQPELERIKKKYPKDNAMQQQEKMKVFKEHNINPAGSILGCLPMLLQMPIWAALYSGLAIDIDLRQASFIPGWIPDLANPDMVIGRLTHPYFTAPMIGAVYGLNLLPILLGGVFFFQMRYSMLQQKQLKAGQPPSEMDEQQKQTQKISQFMFLLFPIMLYNASSGFNLYMLASSVAGFFDTWLVRRHMKEKGILPAQMGPSL